eukprot:3310474-Alexandrium_andersonii.AAC.1
MPLEGGASYSLVLIGARLAGSGSADKPRGPVRGEGVSRKAGLQQVVVGRALQDARSAAGGPSGRGSQQ